MLPECNSDYLGEVIYLSEASTLICDEKREWRSATDIEAPKTQFFLFSTNTDTLPGLCLKEKSGKIVQVDYDKFYICADSIWKAVTPAEYNFGKCEGVYLDSVVEISPSEKYICQDTGWRQLDLIETGLGICTAKRQNEMGTSIWSAGLRPHVCDNEKWREATDAEKALGVCTEEKKGITDSILYATEFYTCDGKYWRFATDEEIFHTRLGECTKRSLKVTATIDTVDYICDTDGWRTKDSLEQQIGFCRSTETIKMAKDSVNYICTKDGWKVAKPPELFQGLCKKEIYGIDIVADDGLKYICEETGWRTGNELEQNIGFCNSQKEGYVYETRQNENLSYYTCHDNNWQEATEEEILYSELEDHYKNKCSKKVIDYKTEYLEYKNKYEDLLKKYEELKNNIKMTQVEHIAEQNINDDNKDNDHNESIETTFKSIYHDHILKYKPFYYDIWTCDICLQSFDKKTKTGYNCSECAFDICSKCRVLEKSGYKFLDIFNSKKHKHLLKENKIEANYTCDECKKHYTEARKTYRCKECDFDLCVQCIIKENPEYLSS
jgi:hypothetical protein